MSIQRYDHWESENCMKPYKYGEYVLHSDVVELETKAEKWDMIQWAIDNKIEFVNHPEGITCISYDSDEIKDLEKIYKERERV